MKTGPEFIYKSKRKVTGNESKYMDPFQFIISCMFVVE
jgi:hypothetical protein